MAEPANTKERKKKHDDAVDRLSGLPDEILVSILSRLPLKEAQSTYRNAETAGECMAALRKYADWVCSVVNQHKAANIERFRVEFGTKSCVDEWIRFAMRKGVRVLELDMSLGWNPGDLQYHLGSQVLGIGGGFSTFKDLCTEYTGFKFLNVVDFDGVDVDQDVVEYFINKCPVLERVTVRDSSSLVRLRVVGQGIALKYLMIEQCINLERIEICESNMVSFTYGGDVEMLLLRNLPLLVEVSLSGRAYGIELKAMLDFSYLSCCLSQLETLKISFGISWGETDPVIPLLPNLKCLELLFDENNNSALYHLSFFIRQTPRLHTLVLKLFGDPMKRPFDKKRAAGCSHDCLQVVKFVEYRGYSRQNETMKYLMRTASNLKKIIFEPVDRDYSKVYRLLNPDVIVKDEEHSRAKAIRYKEKLPATLDVVCL